MMSLNPVFKRSGLFPSLEREFDGLLGGFASESFAPQISCKSDENQLTVKAELPGIDEKDVDITIQNDILTIKGEKKKDQKIKDEDYYFSECRYGSFDRSIRIPKDTNIDKATASFKNGVLEIAMPKKEEKKPRKITVKTK